jgi:cytochrome c peroxidase
MPRNNNETTNAGATLGRVLFYDKRLSITNTHSCASCHQQALGFADAEPFSAGVVGESTRRNAMALTNVRYNVQNLHFSDDRVEGLENLTLLPIQDDLELASSLELVEGKLRGTTFYPPLFNAAFGTPVINRDRIAKALAQFLRSLISYQAKFDRAYHVMVEGDIADPGSVLTAQELRGFDVYVESKCDLCHQNDVHVTIAHNSGLDLIPVDPGAGEGRFRPASLRNVGKSGPYMHDGRFANLREVIDFYDQGIQASPGLSPILTTLGEPLRLNLSEDDKLALEAFLLTLTDESFLACEAVPRILISGPFDSNTRVIGF